MHIEKNVFHFICIIYFNVFQDKLILQWIYLFIFFFLLQIWLNEKLTIDEVVDKLNKLTLSDGDLNWHTVSTLVNNVLCKNEDCRKEKKSMYVYKCI